MTTRQKKTRSIPEETLIKQTNRDTTEQRQISEAREQGEAARILPQLQQVGTKRVSHQPSMLDQGPLKKLKTDKGPLAPSTRVWVLSTQVEAQQAEAARAAAELVAN